MHRESYCKWWTPDIPIWLTQHAFQQPNIQTDHRIQVAECKFYNLWIAIVLGYARTRNASLVIQSVDCNVSLCHDPQIRVVKGSGSFVVRLESITCKFFIQISIWTTGSTSKRYERLSNFTITRLPLITFLQIPPHIPPALALECWSGDLDWSLHSFHG